MMKNIFPVLTEHERKLPFYVTSAGEWDHQEKIERKRGFPDIQWLQCWRGKGVLRFHDREQTVLPGQGMLLFPNEGHHYFPVEPPWSVRWVSFNGEHAASMLHRLGFTQSGVYELTHPDAQLKLLLDLQHLLDASNPLSSVEASELIYHLILNLYKYAAPGGQKTYESQSDKMSTVFSYIESHAHEPITLQQIAEILKVSPQHACLLFRQTIGLRPFEYVTKVRIRKAKALLLNHPELSVKEIGSQVGYEHTSYFIKVFKQQEQMTPNQFRQIHHRFL